MQALSAWARDLVLIIALAAVLEMALPQGDFRRFARLVMGLLVLLALLKPLMGYLQIAVSLPGGDLRSVRTSGQGYTFVDSGSPFPVADGAYEAQVRDHIVRLVAASLGIEAAGVSVDVDLKVTSGWPGSPQRLRVRVSRVPERLVAGWIQENGQQGQSGGGETAAGTGGGGSGPGGAGAVDVSAARTAALAAIGQALRAQLAGLYRLDPAAVEVSMPR